MMQQRLQIYFDSIINNNRLSHAYLLVGAKGSGKSELANWIAKKIFCQQINTPCCSCPICKRIDEDEFSDVTNIVPIGTTIKVEQIRQLKLDTAFSSLENSKKVYIIHQVEKMSVSASNSVLKMMEEPDSDRHFILLTENQKSVLSTIQSRTQILLCDKIRAKHIEHYLVDNEIPKSISYLMSKLLQNKDEALNLLTNDFQQFVQHVFDWCELLLSKKNQAFIFVQRQLMQHFSDKNLASMGLDIVLIVYSDVAKSYIMSEFITSLQYKQGNVTQIDVDKILKAKEMLQANVSVQACYEWLALQLCE